MNPGKQLEMWSKNEQLRYLEDIPDYQKKLRAWEYVNNPERAKIHAGLLAEFHNHRRGPDAKTSMLVINKRLGFPRAELTDNGNLSFPDIEVIKEYCKDILDSNGHVLPSKNSLQKAA